MAYEYEQVWESIHAFLEHVLSAILRVFDSTKRALSVVAHFLSIDMAVYVAAAFKTVKHGILVAGHALITAVIVLISWIAVIYLVCLSIFFICKLVRWYHRRQRNLFGERQPLLHTRPRRSSTSSRPGSGRRDNERRTHRELFRVEIGRRRQDQLRREQTRLLEVHSREDRTRRRREALQQRLSMHVEEQHETIITWLQTSSGLPTFPDYGTIPPRHLARFSALSETEPPPPYPRSVGEEPPPYTSFPPDSPPAYH